MNRPTHRIAATLSGLLLSLCLAAPSALADDIDVYRNFTPNPAKPPLVMVMLDLSLDLDGGLDPTDVICLDAFTSAQCELLRENVSIESFLEFIGTSFAAVRATGDKEEAESREVLDAFFVGKALAETLLERAGEAVSEALSAVGRAEAERDEAIRQFQDDVVNKAREAQRRERGGDDQIR